MLSLLTTAASFILCIITTIFVIKKNASSEKIRIYVIVNAIALPCVVLMALFGLLLNAWLNFAVIILNLIVSILLALWHYKLLAKLKGLKKYVISNSVVYCKSCGNSMPANTEYCTSCGNRLREVQQ